MNTASLSVVALLLSASPSGAAADASPNVAVINNCLVSPIDYPDIPAEDAGKLIELHVQEGHQVKAGDVLAQIDDQEALLQRFAAERERDASLARANDEIEVQFATASYEVADAELAQNQEINRRTDGSAVSSTEIRRLQLTKHRAQLQIEKAKLDRKIALIEAEVQQAAVKSAEVIIQRRQIVSPIDGTVLKLYRQRDEWVAAGEPVLQIIRMDKLRVEGFVDASQYNAHELSDRDVLVTVSLARGRTASFRGRIVLVSPLVQAGNKLRVRADVANNAEQGEWLLRPGMTASMAIKVQ